MRYTIENTVEKGRPVRVFVDGKEVVEAIYADTERGIVEAYHKPPRIDGESNIATYIITGTVTVEPL